MKTANLNLDLGPLPTDEAIVGAVAAITARPRVGHVGATANEVARYLRIQGARRAGNGAVKGTWSGTMSPALRVSPRLLALARRGQIKRRYNRLDYRWEYWPEG